VCDPLNRYHRTGYLTNWTVAALATVGHEAAHVKGVTS
jgi:hypothetical protein